MNNIKNNLEDFFNLYKLDKSNYNIIITGNNGCGKYELVKEILKKYYSDKTKEQSLSIENNPDIYHVSLPIYDSQGKIIRILNNDEKVLYKFGFIDKIDDKRIGTEITIDQVRSLIKFTQLSSYIQHKFIIINDCDYLNREANAALLKTLEETKSRAIFLLLTSSIEAIPLTLRSRCQTYNYKTNIDTLNIKSFFEYFLFMYPELKKLSKDSDILNEYKNIEEELSSMKNKETDPIILSNKWNKQGVIILDYLITLFMLLVKGKCLSEKNPVKKLYYNLFEKINITPENSIYLINYLIQRKKDLFYNVNKKLFFDDLLIVLNSKL